MNREQLRVPRQVAPVDRTSAAPELERDTDRQVRAARVIWPPNGDDWCSRFGLPPQLCEIIYGGGTGPTFPR
jgi:hypothetical protein